MNHYPGRFIIGCLESALQENYFNMAGRQWLFPSALLCLYGFFKEMRPSEPFLTPYLVTVKNISEEAVDNQIYPVWTYSYMVALIPVFLFTDILRYKPVIVFEGCTYLGTWALLLWGWGVPLMKLMQMMYGLASATEIAYYSYIYAAVSADHYQQVSSYTRSATLTGNFIAGTLGQLLYSLSESKNILFTLNIISMTSVAIATTVSLFLPRVTSSTYFHRTRPDTVEAMGDIPPGDISSEANDGHSAEQARYLNSEQGANPYQTTVVANNHRFFSQFSETCRENFNVLWLDFKNCYRNRHLLKWSLWWAFATCGYFQIGNYIQNLWQVIFDKSDADVSDVFNGAVEAASTLAGATAAFCIMFTKINWDIFGEILMGLVSVMDSILLVCMASTSNIWLCYSLYIVFRASYQLVITIATYQIAKHLIVQRYALVFGCNMFAALVLQSLLTLIVVDHRTLNAPPETQFLIYSGYFYVLGALFCCKAIYTMTIDGWRWSWRNRHEIVPTDGEDDPSSQSNDGATDGDADQPMDDARIDIGDEEPLN